MQSDCSQIDTGNILKLKREEFSVEIRRKSREQQFHKNRQMALLQHELTEHIYQFEDLMKYIPTYLDTTQSSQERFHLVAAALQLTNGEDEPWKHKVTQLILSNTSLLIQLKRDFYDENLSECFREHSLKLIVRLTSTTARLSIHLIDQGYDTLLLNCIRFSHSHHGFLEQGLLGISNLLMISVSLRQQLIAQQLHSELLTILLIRDDSKHRPLIYKRIALILNTITRDRIYADNQVEWTRCVFALLEYDGLTADQDYVSDISYCLYQLAVSILENSQDLVIEEFQMSLLNNASFFNLIKGSLISSNYSILIPCLRLLAYLFRYPNNKQILFALINEPFAAALQSLWQHELILIRAETLKLLVAIFSNCQGDGVTSLANQTISQILSIAKQNVKVINQCFLIFNAEIRLQLIKFKPSHIQEIVELLAWVLTNSRETESQTIALDLCDALLLDHPASITKQVMEAANLTNIINDKCIKVQSQLVSNKAHHFLQNFYCADCELEH